MICSAAARARSRAATAARARREARVFFLLPSPLPLSPFPDVSPGRSASCGATHGSARQTARRGWSHRACPVGGWKRLVPRLDSRTHSKSCNSKEKNTLSSKPRAPLAHHPPSDTSPYHLGGDQRRQGQPLLRGDARGRSSRGDRSSGNDTHRVTAHHVLDDGLEPGRLLLHLVQEEECIFLVRR